MTSDAELREAFAGTTEVTGDGSGCPSAEHLWASAREELRPAGEGARSQAVLLHLAACGSCAAAWRLAREMRSTGMPASAGRPGLLLALAASLVLVIGTAALLLPRMAPQGEPSLRAPGVAIPRPTPTVETIPRSDPVLRWTPGPEGTLYEVQVTDEDLDLLGRGWRLQDPEFRIDPAALADLPEGASVLWRVTARLPDGREVASPTFTTPVR